MNIEFDKKLELIYGLLYTVDKDLNNTLYKGLFIEELPTYSNEMYNLCRNNMSNELVNYIKEYGISTNYNQAAYLALSLDDNYNIIENDDLKENLIKINPKYNKEKIERLLKEFVLKSNYENFYNNHKPLYDKIIKSFKDSMNNMFDESIILDFYGYKLGDMSVKLYNFTSGSQGLLIGKKQYYIQRVDSNGTFKSKLNNLFHEFSHPYINPLVDKYFNNVEFSNLLEESKAGGLPSCYRIKNDNSYEILKEYLVRSVALYLQSKYDSNENIIYRILKENENGFIYIEEIAKVFDKKDNYKTFEEFFKNEIVKCMININDNITIKSR